MRRFIVTMMLLCSATFVSASELVQMIQTYQADRGALGRLYTNRLSDEYFSRMEEFNQEYLQTLNRQDFDSFSEDGKIDYVLFRNYLEKDLATLELDRREFESVKSVLTFGSELEDFVKGRRRAQIPESQKLAASWSKLADEFDAAAENLDSKPKFTSWQKAELAAQAVNSLKRVTGEAYRYYFTTTRSLLGGCPSLGKSWRLAWLPMQANFRSITPILSKMMAVGLSANP